jgi:hypothetical protein
MSRIKNWDKNFNAESAGAMLSAYKDKMKEQLAIEFQIQEMIENEVKKIMGESGLPTWHNIPYLNFGRKVFKINRKYFGLSKKSALDLEVKLAIMNGLQRPMLLKIRRKILKLQIPV